jgi:hypothetical protein
MWAGEAASNDRHRFGFLKKERQNAGNGMLIVVVQRRRDLF